jgi:Ion channel
VVTVEAEVPAEDGKIMGKKGIFFGHWQESRQLIGGSILFFMLFFSHYLPEWVNCALILLVVFMTLAGFGKSKEGVILLLLGSGLPFLLLYLHGWKSPRGNFLGVGEAVNQAVFLGLLCILIYGAAIWIATLLRKRKAGFDEVVGACNLYIWIAVIYACLYTIISKFDPLAFHLEAKLSPRIDPVDLMRSYGEMYYFSFVTQTTLGYGDIIPVSHFARAFSISQAIIGQFYVAVVLTYILNLWVRDLGRQMDRRLKEEESELVELEESVKADLEKR